MTTTFRCSPRSAATAHARDPRSAKRFVVDIHCHVHVPAADAIVGSLYDPQSDPIYGFASHASRAVNQQQMAQLHGKLTSMAERIADMDRQGVDVQAISPAPHQYYYWAPADAGAQAARIVNDAVADIAQSHGGRFVGIGTVPLQHPDLAVVELERAVRRLGLRGIEIGTNVNGNELSHGDYDRFFRKAEDLGVLLFMHPLGTTEWRRLSEHYLVNVVGNPLDSTIAISNLIFGGTLEAHPRLKLCIAHGGGYLPAYAGRMDHAHAARPDCRGCIQQPPSEYLKRLYFDSVVFEPAQLEYLVRQYGADHVVLGTDYPYDMSDADPVGTVQRAHHLTEAERAAICGGNAARLLGLELPSTMAAPSSF